MKEIILSAAFLLSAGGLTLVALGTTFVTLKDAWDYRDWYLCSLGLLLLFLAVLPLLAITISSFL